MTIPAYQDNRDYNQEIDVLLWNSFDDKLNKDIMDSFKDKKKENNFSVGYQIDFELCNHLEDIIKELHNEKNNQFYGLVFE